MSGRRSRGSPGGGHFEDERETAKMEHHEPADGLEEEQLEEEQDDHAGRFCDAFVGDFEGTSALIVSALENAAVHESPSALAIVETLTEIVHNGETWLPAETSERVESELVPHAVQLLLASAVEGDEAVNAVADFLALVLERTAHRLLYCDADLLPSLVRILDERRAFYESTKTDETITASLYVDSDDTQRVSPLYLRNVVNWGELGGFTLLLRCLQASSARSKRDEEDEEADSKEHEDEVETNAVDTDGVFAFDAIQCIYRVLYAVKDHLSRAFLTQFLVPLMQSSRIYIATVPTTEFARLPRDSVVEIVQIVDLVVSRIADTQEEVDDEDGEQLAAVQEAQVGVELLRLDLMLRFFTSTSLEKRIYGLVEIIDVVSKASAQHAACFTQWIQQNRLAELLFGETKHPELIKRCLPLLRFVMATASEHAVEWLEAVWACFIGKTRLSASGPPTSSVAINDVVRVSTHSLLLEVVEFADRGVLRRLLELSRSSMNPDSDMIALVSALAKKTDTLRDPVLLYLWECVAGDDTVTNTALVDQALDEISAIISRALDEESFPYDGCLVSRFLERCVDSIEASSSCAVLQSLRLVEKLGGLAHQRSLRADRAIAKRLVPTILTEFQAFKQQTPEGAEEDADAEVYLNGIRVRLLALRSGMLITEVAEVAEQTASVVDSLWEMCILQAQQIDESALFFQWIEYCFRTRIETPMGDSRRLLSDDVATQLVETKFQSLPSAAMTLSALCCFHHLFRKVNAAQGGLVFYSAEGEAIEDKQEDQEEAEETEGVSDLMTGEAMTGMPGLWHLALHTTDEVAAEEAITLLARHHLDFVPALRESEIALAAKRAFVETCVEHLATDGGEASTEALVNRCLDCLRYFLDASQADKGDVVSPIEATPSNQRLDKYALENLEQKLQMIDVYPSPMKETMSSSTENSVSAPMLYAGPRRPSWNFKQHHALLEAIQDEGDDQVGSPEHEGEDENNEPKRSPVRRGELTIEIPSTERRLSIDTSVAGSLRPTQRTKSPSVQSRPDLQWIYGSQAASSQGPEFTIKGLDVDAAADPNPVTVAQLLVSRGRFVETLFELVRRQEAETSRRAWGLLCQLPISTNLLKRMVRLRPEQVEATEAAAAEVLWSELLDCGCVYRLLYSLRLVEALLLPLGIEKTSEDAVKRQWRERFVRLGGVPHLLTIAETLCRDDVKEDIHVVTLACIASVARVLTYFAQLSHASATSKVDLTSPYDTRLLQSTLPSCLADRRLDAVIDAAVELVPALMRFMSRPSELELTAACAIELVCSLVPLNPSNVKTSVEDKCAGGMLGWLESIFLLITSSDTRTKVAASIASVEPPAGLREDGEVFTQAVLHSSLQLAFMGSGSSDVSPELLELIVNLSPLLARSPPLVRWTLDSQIVPSLLSKIERLSRTVDSNEAFVRAYLRVLGSISSQAVSIKQAVLAFRPECEALYDSQVPWILEHIATHTLWPTSSNEDGVFPITGARDALTRQAAQETILRLAFDSSNPSPESTRPVLRSLSRFHSRVEDRLVLQGRPWHYTPADELQEPAEAAFAGLVNPGCVCYMNSLMQQLFMMPAFRHGLFNLDASVSPTNASSSWQDEVAELQKLFVALVCSDRKALDPTPFALSHRDLDGNPTDLNLQMDADEFFCLLLDRVETFLHQQIIGSTASTTTPPTQPPVSFLDQCFGGVLVNQILTEHGQLSEREEKFFALSLDISKKQQLTESLLLYVQGETLEGDNAYYCEHAKKKVSATKRVCIKTLPQTLVCHLKRFEFDFDTMEKIKIHDYLAFPDEIDMFPYTSEALASPNGARGGGSDSCMYELVGIVVHSGTSDMGHYYSYIRDRGVNNSEPDPETHAWFEFNDQTVKPFDVATMGDECFGGEEITQKWDHGARAYMPVVQRKRRSAYMLIYEQRSDQAKPSRDKQSVTVLSPVVFDWATTPTSVQQLKRAIDGENQDLRNVVYAAADDHVQFLAKMVEAATIIQRENRGPEEDDDDTDEQENDRSSVVATGYEMAQLRSADAVAAAVACEHVFGISCLLSSEDDASVARILHAVEMWLCVSTTDQTEREKKRFCKWLLRTVSKRESKPAERNVVRRSWLFDLLFFCDKRPSLVQSCSSLLLTSLRFLTASKQRDDHHVATDVLHYLVEMFFDREDIDIADPATGSVFPVPQASIIHATTLIGTFLKDCVAVEEDDDTTHAVLRDLFLKESGFVDRFLFSLQAQDSPTSGVAPLTSRVRSCTYSIERQLLHDAFTALASMAGSVLEDPRLLLNESVLKNMLTFQFDSAMTPLIVDLVCKRLTRTQSDKLVSMLLAVLEEVKSTHLEQLLELFGALLNAAEEGEERDQQVDLSSLQQHILSPTNGLLEAAAYYRDHRTLHEYAFLLVEFAVSRVASSTSLQKYFQQKDGFADQVAWVNDWLVSYLDPNHTIRSSGDSTNDADEQTHAADESESAVLEKEVRALFQKAERGFGFQILHATKGETSSQQDHEEAEAVEEEEDEEEQIEETKQFAVESLEDSDLSFSSDSENQDDDDDHDDARESTRTLQQMAKAKKELTLLSTETKTTRLANPPRDPRSSPDDEIHSSSSSSYVVRAHMSSAA